MRVITKSDVREAVSTCEREKNEKEYLRKDNEVLNRQEKIIKEATGEKVK